MKTMKTDNVFGPFGENLSLKLDHLKQVPPRNAIQQTNGRANFLFEANEILQTISHSSKIYQNGWIATINLWIWKTGRTRALVTILFALILIFGSSTTLLAAAQSALPGQVLYRVKLISEVYRARITTQIQNRFELSLQYSSRRVWEAMRLVQKGDIPSEDLLKQYQNQIESTLVLAAGLPDDEITHALIRLQSTLHEQETIFLQLSDQAGGKPFIQEWMSVIQNQSHIVAEGLKAPMTLHGQVCSGTDDSLILTKQSISSQNGTDGTNPWDCFTPTPGAYKETASISISTPSDDAQGYTKPSILPVITPTQSAPRQPITVTAQEIIGTPYNHQEQITQTTPG